MPLLDRLLWAAVLVALFFLFVIFTRYTSLGEWFFSFGHRAWEVTQDNKEGSSHEALLLAVKLLSKENSELATLLGRESVGRPSIAARVLVRSGSRAPFDTFIIDVGTQQGIQKGDVVIVAQKTIIGKIAETHKHESKVILFSAPDVVIPVSVGEKNVPVDAKGRGGGNYEASIPRETPIAEGDLILSAENPGYLLGAVAAIKENETDQFKKILFTTPINLQQTSYVDVLLSGR